MKSGPNKEANDEISFKLKFIISVDKIVYVSLKSIPEKHESKKIIQDMWDAIQIHRIWASLDSSSDAMFLTIREHMTRPDFKKFDQLKPIKEALIVLMKKYNEDKVNANVRNNSSDEAIKNDRTKSNKM